MFDGIEIIMIAELSGSKTGIFDGRRVYVSPAFASLLRSAKTESELVALVQSLKVRNVGPPLHDAQWHIDDMQIKMARLKNAFATMHL